MFDSHKIDDYFDGEKSLDGQFDSNKLRTSHWYRIAKLGFPCVAAALLGLMIVMPSIRKSVDLRDNITVPRKNEIDKLHIESTVFNMTDSKNRVNHLTADNIDETEPNSKKVKINNPRGQIPTDSGEIYISANTGYFTQDVNILDLQDNVSATVNDSTTITSSEASYDFNTEMGYGNKPVFAQGEWGTLQAKSFNYDKKANILTLYGYSKYSGTHGELTAEEENKYFVSEEKIVSKGNVKIKQKGGTLFADEVVSYLSSTEPKELIKAEATGNVEIKTDKETATGGKGIYDAENNKIVLYGTDNARVKVVQGKNILTASKMIVHLIAGEKQEVSRVEALGQVVVITPKGKAKGNRGIYNPQKKLVELWDNVQIEQDGNFINGEHAETDLTTSISRIKGKQKGGRVSGTFYKRKK